MYKVIERFEDAQDNGHEYQVGDTYPRDGLEVSEERFTELSLSLIHISEPTRLRCISYAVFCLKKKSVVE
ncbi:hypothetical protein JMUB7519_28020 [Staphylococcus aureus]